MEHKRHLPLGDVDRHPNKQRAGVRLIGGLYARYRGLRKRLADMLGRGERDYTTLTAVSQEIGRLRQKLRDELQRRRGERRRQHPAQRGSV